MSILVELMKKVYSLVSISDTNASFDRDSKVYMNSITSSRVKEYEDCILAVKFVGPQLSLCRPALKDKSEWVNIRIEDPGFFSSRVMYSKRDKMFSMLGFGGIHMGSWDLETHKVHNFRSSRYHEKHKNTKSQWERLSLCCSSEQLVESRTGLRYMVKWYTRWCEKTLRLVWERFMVYMVLGKSLLCTDNIRDACIFLSTNGEPFCLEASSYGLTPNCIYSVGSYDFGKVNISDNVRVGGFTYSPAPYFFPPSTPLY